MDIKLEGGIFKVLRCSSMRKQSHRLGNTTSMGNVEVPSSTAVNAKACCTRTETPFQVTVTTGRDHDINVYTVKHHCLPTDFWIEDSPPVGHVSLVIQPESTTGYLEPSCSEPSNSNALGDMHIVSVVVYYIYSSACLDCLPEQLLQLEKQQSESAKLMEEFMVLATDNTSKNLETCGVLGAFLKNGTFYVTTLIIPKQETTAHSCQALNEEEIHAILDGESLFPAGWIHTHPSQTCFLSSIDLHTQYSYQVMLPEAIAIVMAPTDPTRSYGIFRLTNPGGIAILKACKESGFHSHSDTADGSPLFESCCNIYINHNLRLEIIDLRSSYPW